MKLYQVAKDTKCFLAANVAKNTKMIPYKLKYDLCESDIVVDYIREQNDPGVFAKCAILSGWNVSLANALEKCINEHGGVVFAKVNSVGIVSSVYCDSNDVKVLS